MHWTWFVYHTDDVCLLHVFRLKMTCEWSPTNIHWKVTVYFVVEVYRQHSKVLGIWYWCRCFDLLRPLRMLCSVRHLSVCLLATLHNKYWPDLHTNFTTDVSVHKEELIRFCMLPPDPDPGIFWRILQHWEIGYFSTICLISSEIVIGFSWKFYHRCIVG